MFSFFKQYYTHFHTLFHSHVFPKNTNNVTKQLQSNLRNDKNARWQWQTNQREREREREEEEEGAKG